MGRPSVILSTAMEDTAPERFTFSGYHILPQQLRLILRIFNHRYGDEILVINSYDMIFISDVRDN